MRDCFEPATRLYLQGEYRMLIFDGHASHVSNDFIRFTREHKTVCLCLPAHSIHLLQPLDGSVFGPLKRNYETLLAGEIRFTTYNIDKAAFIYLIQKARRRGISTQNIQPAWRATGIIPYNPSAVFRKLLARTNTDNDPLPDLNTPIQTRFFQDKYPYTRKYRVGLGD